MHEDQVCEVGGPRRARRKRSEPPSAREGPRDVLCEKREKIRISTYHVISKQSAYTVPSCPFLFSDLDLTAQGYPMHPASCTHTRNYRPPRADTPASLLPATGCPDRISRFAEGLGHRSGYVCGPGQNITRPHQHRKPSSTYIHHTIALSSERESERERARERSCS